MYNAKVRVLLLAFVMMLLSACSSGSPYEKLADELHALTPNSERSAFDYDVSYLDFQEHAGLTAVDDQKYPHDVGSLRDLLINEDFYNAYIEKYGMSDLIDHCDDYLNCAEDTSNYNPNDYTEAYIAEVNNRDKQIHETLYSLPAFKDLDTIVFDGKEIQSKHGADGYYGGQKDTDESREVKGEFNDTQKDNEIYEESASQEEETSYYGDWMVRHENGSRYNEGKYGWNNGVFEDELAHWDSYNTYEIYYRGEEWANVSASSLEDIHIEFKKLEEDSDQRFYFAYNNIYLSDRVNWVKEPEETGDLTSGASSLTGDKVQSCEAFLEGFTKFMNEEKADGEYTIDRSGKYFTLMKDNEVQGILVFYVDGKPIDELDDSRLSLRPYMVMLMDENNPWNDSFSSLAGYFIGYADSAVGGAAQGEILMNKLYSENEDYYNLGNDHKVMSDFSDSLPNVTIVYK